MSVVINLCTLEIRPEKSTAGHATVKVRVLVGRRLSTSQEGHSELNVEFDHDFTKSVTN